MRYPAIRNSIGTFEAAIAAEVERRLDDSRLRLEAGIRAMRGNLGFHAGVDRAALAMTNVSMWRSVAGAQQMASFQPMLDLAGESTALGVRFQRPIHNFETIWTIEEGGS